MGYFKRLNSFLDGNQEYDTSKDFPNDQEDFFFFQMMHIDSKEFNNCTGLII